MTGSPGPFRLKPPTVATRASMSTVLHRMQVNAFVQDKTASFHSVLLMLASCLAYFIAQNTSHGSCLTKAIISNSHKLQITICSIMTVALTETSHAPSAGAEAQSVAAGPPYPEPTALDAHIERSWEHFRSLGSPQWHVAPMVDQSELPFRMLCRAHGAQAAYTPMLHARLFLEQAGYRAEHFTTCQQDRPLFVQFCANDPSIFIPAAKIVQDQCDYIDLNLGCPQRIAKRGYYGSFLMDNLELVQQLVVAAAQQLSTPISCKIRLFSDLQKTIQYAQMLQASGCSLLAVHGRTRDMKDHSAHRADWDAIAAVRSAIRIPVLANGDVRTFSDAVALMKHTGADGVMSAEPLLMDPALFSPQKNPEVVSSPMETFQLCEQYLSLAAAHPAHMRMVKGHVHKLLQGWLAEFTDIRDRLNREAAGLGISGLQKLVGELGQLIAATGRDHPIPKIPERKLKQIEREAAKAAAIAEQEREAAALAEIGVAVAAAAPVETGAAAEAAAAVVAVGQPVDRPVIQPVGQRQSSATVAAAAAADEPALKRHCVEATAAAVTAVTPCLQS